VRFPAYRTGWTTWAVAVKPLPQRQPDTTAAVGERVVADSAEDRGATAELDEPVDHFARAGWP
jgi:hypothetical protein